MFSPKTSKASSSKFEPEISAVQAAELGIEYASLRARNNCPLGIYITPSPDTILRWHGVFFVHKGPYGGSILRFTITFPTDIPQTGPSVRFDSDVFHPMVDPKTKIWYPRGSLASWRPRIDHIPRLLHHLKSSFKTAGLASVTEGEARNRQVWSLYHHSPQTFLSLTTQRSLTSSSNQTLFSDSTKTLPSSAPSSPRAMSFFSQSDEVEEGPISFRAISEGERERLWLDSQKSLGV